MGWLELNGCVWLWPFRLIDSHFSLLHRNRIAIAITAQLSFKSARRLIKWWWLICIYISKMLDLRIHFLWLGQCIHRLRPAKLTHSVVGPTPKCGVEGFITDHISFYDSIQNDVLGRRLPLSLYLTSIIAIFQLCIWHYALSSRIRSWYNLIFA